MPTLPESGVKLILDIGEFQSAVDTAIKDANKLDSLAPVIKVSTTVNTSAVDEATRKLNGLQDETVTVKVNTNDRDWETRQYRG